MTGNILSTMTTNSGRFKKTTESRSTVITTLMTMENPDKHRNDNDLDYPIMIDRNRGK